MSITEQTFLCAHPKSESRPRPFLLLDLTQLVTPTKIIRLSHASYIDHHRRSHVCAYMH
jgi:hypothetical protein